MIDMRLNKRGGRRVNVHLPAMTPDQVREARAKRLAGVPIKNLMAEYNVSRGTLRLALYGLGAYQGIV